MEKIHDLEDKLFNDWEDYSKNNEDNKFVRDGLIYNGNVINNGFSREKGNEEELWHEAKRKIVFLMKDSNNNPDEDYRNWNIENPKSAFFKYIFAWLNGLSKISTSVDIIDIDKTYKNKLPLVIVNAKKESGENRINNNYLYNHANKYMEYLRKQIKEIYKPNIIVCGGGSDTILNIAKEIYNNSEFIKYKNENWIYYSPNDKLILINSYHPSAPFISDKCKYYELIEKFKDVLSENII